MSAAALRLAASVARPTGPRGEGAVAAVAGGGFVGCPLGGERHLSSAG
ncbi:hypothetical protein [Streptomyces californicus]